MSNTGNKSLGGKIVGSIFFLVFFIIGTVFMCLLLTEFYRDLAIWNWEKVPCKIISSEVHNPKESKGRYLFKPEYSYKLNNRKYTGTTYKRKYFGSFDYNDAKKIQAKFPEGSTIECMVNPANPHEAVLTTRVQWMLLPFAIIPLIFICIGLFGVIFTWKNAGISPPGKNKSFVKNKSLIFMPLFFSAFLIIGLIATFFMGALPAMRIMSAKGWKKVPCTVISSRLNSKRHDKSTTYMINILYEYEIDGKKFRSNRYNFFSGSTSSKDWKSAVVYSHHPGKKTFCFVNPGNPEEAVLSRAWSTDMLFGLIPLIFVIVGGIGLAYSVKKISKAKQKGPSSREDSAGHRNDFDYHATAASYQDLGPPKLKGAKTPLKSLLFSIVFAVFWNGIVSVFICIAVKSFIKGRPEWFLTIFLIPFVLIGLLAFFAVLYSLMALFNPRIKLNMVSAVARLGETFKFEWSFGKSAGRIKYLTINIEERKIWTTTSGNKSRRNSRTLTTLPVVNTNDFRKIPGGLAEAELPADSRPTSDTDNEKIRWFICVKGEVKMWPDVNVEYEVPVLPPDLSATSKKTDG